MIETILATVSAICAILLLLHAYSQKLAKLRMSISEEIRIRKTICKLGGAKKIKRMSDDEFLETYSKEIGEEPCSFEVDKICDKTGADFEKLIRYLISREISIHGITE